MRFRLVDWCRPALRRRYDCILASDVIYEARSFGPLVALLQRYLARGGLAVLAEPGRVNAPPFFTLLRQRGFTYRKHTQRVRWEGTHLHLHLRHPSCKSRCPLTEDVTPSPLVGKAGVRGKPA